MRPAADPGARLARTHGFSLVETLAVLACVIIVALLAYPGYARYVIKARRAEAQSALLELLQQQEQYYTLHNSYIAFSFEATEPEARRYRWWSGARAASSGHELRGEACPDSTIDACIVLTALPGTDRVDRHFRDPECQALTLRSTGARGATGPAARCWP